MKSAVVVLTLQFLILFSVRCGMCWCLYRPTKDDVSKSVRLWNYFRFFFSLIYGVLVEGRLSFNNRQDVSAFFAFQETG